MQQEFTRTHTHSDLPHFGSCKHCTPLLAIHACLGAIFFDYQFYFSVSCESPRLAHTQTTQCVRMHSRYVGVPTCLIYCWALVCQKWWTRITPHTAMRRSHGSVCLSFCSFVVFFVLISLSSETIFPVSANSSLFPFHIHVSVRTA